jgi:hypothetical protein
VFLVRVASKGLTGANLVRVANKGLKVSIFSVICGQSIRVANKGLRAEYLGETEFFWRMGESVLRARPGKASGIEKTYMEVPVARREPRRMVNEL